ncbi:hypothetical protein ACFX2B_029525 [Malus domestica]
MKSIHTAGPLPFESKGFVVKLPEKDDRGGSSSLSKRLDRDFKVTLKPRNEPDQPLPTYNISCAGSNTGRLEAIQAVRVMNFCRGCFLADEHTAPLEVGAG